MLTNPDTETRSTSSIVGQGEVDRESHNFGGVLLLAAFTYSIVGCVYLAVTAATEYCPNATNTEPSQCSVSEDTRLPLVAAIVLVGAVITGLVSKLISPCLARPCCFSLSSD